MSILRPTKTIDDVLKEFLADQEKRLSPRTYHKYDSIIHYLRNCLNNYAYMGLGDRDRKRLDRMYSRDPQAFVKLFAPQEIIENLYHFDYYMERKVIDSKGVMNAAEVVIKKLVAWLDERGYVRLEDDSGNADVEVDSETSEFCPPVQPDADPALDEFLASLPEFRGEAQDQAQATALRAGLIRWIDRVPDRPVLLILTSLRDARWWLDHSDRLFAEIADRLGPHAHLLGRSEPPTSVNTPSVRTIYTFSDPDEALYYDDDEAATLYRDRVHHGLVLRQSIGKNSACPYLRVVQYVPPEEQIYRFALIADYCGERSLDDYLSRRESYECYEMLAGANAESLFDETDIPNIKGVRFVPFHPRNGREVQW